LCTRNEVSEGLVYEEVYVLMMPVDVAALAGFRGRGLTYDLAQAAVEFAREAGAAAVEGYPIVAKPGGKITWDEASVGTPQVFGAAGLAQVSSPTVRRRVMRADFR
jgi:GNAT superfamily N-acetyltransferase